LRISIAAGQKPVKAGRLVPLAEVVAVREQAWEKTIYHKDLLPVVFVTSDAAGDLDSSLYGMFALAGRIADEPPAGRELAQHYIGQPDDTFAYAMRWDGEWQITYETFRDMGIAYAVGLVLI
jgi:multidrug efflux pump subunit AcrB